MPVLLQQVVQNLIMNAVEAMVSITDRPRELLVRSTLDGSHGIYVAVQDTGIGLDAKDGDQIFNAFFTRKSGGMGMGLSICRSIVEVHNGRVWATPNVPRGAVFQFTVPANPAARTASAARPPAWPAPTITTEDRSLPATYRSSPMPSATLSY